MQTGTSIIMFTSPMMTLLGPTRVLGRFSERATTVILYCWPMVQLVMLYSVLVALRSTVPRSPCAW